MEPRPKIDAAMRLEAAAALAAKIDLENIDSIAESICAEYSYPMDGFELSKKLDRYQSWDTTRQEMETLDEMDSLVAKAHREAEKNWFERNDIKPPLEIGTRIQWHDITGVIEGIYEHGHAKYLVKPDVSTIGDGRYLVNFEDAEPIAKEPA